MNQLLVCFTALILYSTTGMNGYSAPIVKLGAPSITRTTFGIPHIYAANLKEASYATGYAQAEDHLCVLAHGFIKANSERSKYFGPSSMKNQGDNPEEYLAGANLISDFAYKALRIRRLASEKWSHLSQKSKEIIFGYTRGYNRFLQEKRNGKHPNSHRDCISEPWVKSIDSIDLLTYIFSAQLRTSSEFFLDLIFYAHPLSGEEYLPNFPSSFKASRNLTHWLEKLRKEIKQREKSFRLPKDQIDDFSLVGSNGWGLGKRRTKSKKGMLLANPHLPYTGTTKLWQSHVYVPGQLNVNGATFIGIPLVVNIGFNENIAWTHQFTQAKQFIGYQLKIDSNDRMHYWYNNEKKMIEKETFSIEVKSPTGDIVLLTKDLFYTDFGPVFETPEELGPLTWNDRQAFTLKDTNLGGIQTIDHWLAINQAKNLKSFKQTFKDFNGLPYINTIYADKYGRSFFIDRTPVPKLKRIAALIFKYSKSLQEIASLAGFPILPAETNLFAFDSLLPYWRSPKLSTRDYVQNSNNTYWTTHHKLRPFPYSPLFGKNDELTLRSRESMRRILTFGGEDNKFNFQELKHALFSHENYLSVLILEDLIEFCLKHFSDHPIEKKACAALRYQLNGQDPNLPGGVLFREIAHLFDTKMNLTQPFDHENPLSTPYGLKKDAQLRSMIKMAMDNIQSAGWDLTSSVSETQFAEKFLYSGKPSGEKLNRYGATNAEGGFNTYSFDQAEDDGTLIPREYYQQLSSSGLGEHGYHTTYGGSWMMLVDFSSGSPYAEGLMTYSQSTDSASPHFNDQGRYFSQHNDLRPILFDHEQVAAKTMSRTVLKIPEKH